MLHEIVMGRGLLDSKTFMDGIALSSFSVLVTAAPFFDRLKNSVYFLMAVDGGFASFAGLLLICLLQGCDNGSMGCCRDLRH